LKKSYYKWILDLLMAVFLVTFINAKVISLSYHEIGGLIMGAVFIIHILLNWQWVKSISKALFSGKLKLRSKITYWLDILIFISMLTVIISGIFISEIIFPNLRIEGFAMKPLHEGMTYLALTLVGVHIGLNWDWVINIFKKMFKISKISRFASYAAKAVVVVILVYGIYCSVQSNFYTKVPEMVSTYTAIYSGEIDGGTLGHEGFGKDRGEMLPPGYSGQLEQEGLEQEISAQEEFDQARQEGQGQGELRRNGQGQGQGGMHNRHGQSGQNNNLFTLIINYLSIIGSIAIVTYYIDKLLKRK